MEVVSFTLVCLATKSALNAHLHLPKRTLNDCTEIYNKIDELLLDMKEDGRGKKSKNINK